MSEDKMTILRMIENGTITSEEGMQLLNAVDKETSREDVILVDPNGEPIKDQEGETGKAKWIDISIERADGSKEVSFSLPVRLIEFGIDISNRFKNVTVSGDFDVEALKAFVLEGQMGEVMVIETEEKKVVRISLRA